jgi:hypothetical protein
MNMNPNCKKQAAAVSVMPENADGPDGGCVPAEGEVVNQVAVGWLLAHQAAQGNHLLPLHINPSQTQICLSF